MNNFSQRRVNTIIGNAFSYDFLGFKLTYSQNFTINSLSCDCSMNQINKFCLKSFKCQAIPSEVTQTILGLGSPSALHSILMLFPAIICISLGSINHLGAADHQLK